MSLGPRFPVPVLLWRQVGNSRSATEHPYTSSGLSSPCLLLGKRLENDLGASCTLSLQCDWWVILGVTRGSIRSLGFHRGRKVWVVIAQSKGWVSVELGSGWSTTMSGGLGGEWGPGGGMWAIRYWWVPANWLCPSLCHRLTVLDCSWLWCWSPGWPLSQPQGGRWCPSCPHS